MQQPFNAREFRDALSAFATGVTIVTAVDATDKPVGMTASSFNSVSMDPPLILWSVTKSSHGADAFKQAANFSVHILASDQMELSNQFAKTGSDKFSGTGFTLNTEGVPVLPQCVCRFDCSAWACYEGGDHWIIVGLVEALYRDNHEPLIFSRGSYATASPLRVKTDNISVESTGFSHVDNLLLYNLARAYRQMADQFHCVVQESGMSVPEWRILASLHGGAPRTLSELAVRTFIEPHVLTDMIDEMVEHGLCVCSGAGEAITVKGTAAGQEKVEHLFQLGSDQENAAMGENPSDNLRQLITLLQSVISNTN